MSNVRVLVVPTQGSEAVQVRRVEVTHDSFCTLVGDVNTDTVFLVDADAVVKVAANGKASAAHAANPRATQVVERFLPGFAKRDRVEGLAVFVGLDPDGDMTDVPDVVVSFADDLFGVARTPE